MKVYSTISELKKALNLLKKDGAKIGFVPTMGALHNGHLSLVKESNNQCDITVVSVYINPTQFNNSSDFEHYPRTLEKDLSLLERENCNIVFTPSDNEIYPDNFEKISLDLGQLAEIMEGKFRPGHFDGVMNVVYRLFDIIQPDKAFFGLKDFQQVAVIKFMVKQLNLPVEIIPCPTLRENDGLAMSSRNIRLTNEDKANALILFKTLDFAQSLKKQGRSPKEVQKEAVTFFKASNLELEYFEIVDPLTLASLENEWVNNSTACIVAYCNDVRLIDNLELN
ncbi:MAG: pantoate--beta-alanine ligase [Crocinitomicaceae bacterium]